MEGSLVIVLMMGLPIFFFLAVWAVGTVVRLSFPEPPLSSDSHPVLMRRKLALKGRAIPVGLREIREDCHWQQSESTSPNYCYGGFARHRIPTDWIADVRLRKN